jgi:hypothetical protein
VRFITWLFDNLDDPTKVGVFAKICWDDVNNGCALSKWGPIEWKEHFEVKHPDSANKLIYLLSVAYAQYVLSLSEK